MIISKRKLKEEIEKAVYEAVKAHEDRLFKEVRRMEMEMDEHFTSRDNLNGWKFEYINKRLEALENSSRKADEVSE